VVKLISFVDHRIWQVECLVLCCAGFAGLATKVSKHAAFDRCRMATLLDRIL